MSTPVRRVVILGAAGRDFHDFNTVFRNDPSARVVAFTATQIPGIEGRRYPAALAGPLYPDGIPIFPEEELRRLIRDEAVDLCVFSYSDVAHATVMHLASLVIAAGADFTLLGAARTMLKARVPVIAVTAVRTGAGKSQTTRYLGRILKDLGLRVVAVRHPMPYGDLAAQACQRFGAYADLDRERCTIEEREEYEPHLASGFVVYAGVDYERILRSAETEADVILWTAATTTCRSTSPPSTSASPTRTGPGTRRATTPARRTSGAPTSSWSTSATRPTRGTSTPWRRRRAPQPGARVLRANSPVVCERPELVRGSGPSSSRTGRR